jgi:hypothetical protein
MYLCATAEAPQTRGSPGSTMSTREGAPAHAAAPGASAVARRALQGAGRGGRRARPGEDGRRASARRPRPCAPRRAAGRRRHRRRRAARAHGLALPRRAPPGGLAMANVTPATRLLEKRRQMFEVQEALEAQKQEFSHKVGAARRSARGAACAAQRVGRSTLGGAPSWGWRKPGAYGGAHAAAAAGGDEAAARGCARSPARRARALTAPPPLPGRTRARVPQEETFRQREEALKRRDLDLQESLIRFSKFLQENDSKRTRAEKRAADEVRARQAKEVEIGKLVEALDHLTEERELVDGVVSARMR